MSLSVQQRENIETEKEEKEVRKTREKVVKDKIQDERLDQFSQTKETTGLKQTGCSDC